MNQSLLNQNFFRDALTDNSASLPVNAEAMIVAEAGEHAVVPCRNLEIEQFARLKLCVLRAETQPRPSLYRYWGGEDYDHLYTTYEQVAWHVGWNNHQLRVVHLAWDTEELVVSSVMEWMQDNDEMFANVMKSQATLLRQQMKTDTNEPPTHNGHPRRPSGRV